MHHAKYMQVQNSLEQLGKLLGHPHFYTFRVLVCWFHLQNERVHET